MQPEELWTNGLLYAFEFIQSLSAKHEVGDRTCWRPIGWDRISELVIQAEDGGPLDWELPPGSIWWCHLDATNPNVTDWLSSLQLLDPNVSIALQDAGRLLSHPTNHLAYQIPIRGPGGILFELLGQSVGDISAEDDIPIILRAWQTRDFLITALHVRGSASNINVLGILEVQKLLGGEGVDIPCTIDEVTAHLACRLARWDDRLFRENIFAVADNIELMFMNRRNKEDLNLLNLILNPEIRSLSTQVLRVRRSLHAREQIILELLRQLRGNEARVLLEGTVNNTRRIIKEQEEVRQRLFTIQDLLQSATRASLQDKSLTITHGLAVLGGCGLVLSIITRLFGVNMDGIPGASGNPHAFLIFSLIFCGLGAVIIGAGFFYLRPKNSITPQMILSRERELQEIIRTLEHGANLDVSH